MPPFPQPTALPVPQNTAGAPQQAPPVASAPAPAPQTAPTPEVANLQKVGADPVVGILRPLGLSPEQKANIYKTYQGAQSQEDFVKAFKGLDAPPEVKASLYKLRFSPPISDLQGAQQAISQVEQQRTQSPFMTSQFERDRDFQKPFPQAVQTGLEMVNKAVQAPVQMGQWLGNQMGNFAETMSSMQPQTPGSVTQERVPEQYRHAGSGAMRGTAGLVGETFGNPTNWPFLAGAEARPLIQKALSMGFAGQMGYGTVQSLQNLYQNWDQMSPADRTEELTKAGFGAYFTKESAQHGFEGTMPTTREQATQSGVRPSQREAAPTNPAAQAPRPAPIQVAPRQPARAGYEAAPPAAGAVGTSTAGQTPARDVGGTSARARLTAALEKSPNAPPSVQPPATAPATAQPNEPVRGPAAAQAPTGAARQPLPSTPKVGALEGLRSQQIEAGRKQLIDRKVDPVMMGQKLGLVYDGYAGGVHSFRDTVKGGGVSVSDAKFSEEFLRQRAEEHRGSIKTEQLSPVVQAKPERARQELAETRPEPTYTRVPSKGRSLDEAKEVVARGEPVVPKKTGSDEAYKTAQQEHAKSRNEYLAAKAQIAREETAPQALAEGKKTQHPVQTEITRFLKTPGRTGKEIADAIDRVAPEERGGLADEMKKRAERAEATVKHVREMSEAKDFDDYLKKKLHDVSVAADVIGTDSQGRPITKIRGRFVTGKGEAGGKGEFHRGAGAGEFKPIFSRPISEEEASFLNMLRGREMKEVKGVDERGRKLKDLTKHPEVKERVDGAMRDLDVVLKEIKSQGGKWTEEQAKRGQDAFALISAGTGKKFIAGKFAEPTTGPAGEPRAEGTAQTRAWMNAVMGRARTSNLSKPSPEEFQRRIEYLEREAKVSRLAEEHLRGTAKEAPKKTIPSEGFAHGAPLSTVRSYLKSGIPITDSEEGRNTFVSRLDRPAGYAASQTSVGGFGPFARGSKAFEGSIDLPKERPGDATRVSYIIDKDIPAIRREHVDSLADFIENHPRHEAELLRGRSSYTHEEARRFYDAIHPEVLEHAKKIGAFELPKAGRRSEMIIPEELAKGGISVRPEQIKGVVYDGPLQNILSEMKAADRALPVYDSQGNLRISPKEASAKAPEKPQERPKPAPKPKVAKAAPEPVKEAPKPKEKPLKGGGVPKPEMQAAIRKELTKHVERPAEGPRKLSADEQTELRELRDLKAGMAGPLDAHDLVKVNDRIRELEGTKLPSEKPKPKSTAPELAKTTPEEEAKDLQARAKQIRNKLFGYDKHIQDLREDLKKAKSPGDRARAEQELQQAIFNRARYRKEIGYRKDAATGKVSYASIEEARKALGAPEEKVSETEATQREQLRELDSRIKSLERSGEYEPTLKRLKDTYEELSGQVRPADASDIVELAKREEKAAKKAEPPKREFIDPKAEDRPITIRAEQAPAAAEGAHGERLLEAIAKGDGDVEKALSLYEKTRPGSGYRDAYDRIARPILEDLGKGNLETLDATRRYERALEIYNAGIKAKSPQALGKALEYAKTGRIAKAGESEKGALSFGGLKGKSPSFGQAVKDWYGRMKDSAAANREAKNLSDRVADLRQQSKGDILVYGEISKHLKPEKPATFYREMYDWAEQKLLPKDKQTITPTPEMEQRFKDEVEPIVKENTRIINKLKSAGYAIKDIAGLMHRVPLGKGQTVEKIVEERMQVGSGNVLSTFASSRKGAKYGVMTDPQTGQRHVVRVRQNGKVYVWDGGQQLGGSIGLKSEFENEGFKFGRGTTKEISDATGKQYYRHAWINNAVENLALRRAERIHDFMENIKQEPEFKRLSTRSKDVRDALGYRAPKVTNAEWIPQLKGYYFEPHIAEVLEREWGRFQKGDFSAYERMSNWMKRSIFWNPLIHVPNIGVHWFGEKGLTGDARLLFRPSEYRALGKAWKTMTDPVEYSKMLEAGLPLMRQPNTHDVTKLFLAKTIDQVASTPMGGKLAKAFGYTNPVQLAKALYRGSSEITWGVHDLAILQSTFARMEQHGWDLQTASREVTKHIPNYRMPPRIWNNRTIGKIMDAPGLSMFSQYHYGAFKSYGEMVRELVHPEKPGDRMRAIDRMAALGLMMYVLYPQLDKLGKALTGDPTATFRRAGSATFPYNVAKLARGIGLLKGKGPQMGVLPFAESVVTPAPIISAGIKAAQSKELTKPGQKPGQVAKKLGQIGVETIGPITGYESGQKTPGKGRFDWRTFLFRMAGGRFERPITKGAGARLATLPKK